MAKCHELQGPILITAKPFYFLHTQCYNIQPPDSCQALLITMLFSCIHFLVYSIGDVITFHCDVRCYTVMQLKATHLNMEWNWRKLLM